MNKILKLSAIALLASSTSLMAQTKPFEGGSIALSVSAMGAEIDGSYTDGNSMRNTGSAGKVAALAGIDLSYAYPAGKDFLVGFGANYVPLKAKVGTGKSGDSSSALTSEVEVKDLYTLYIEPTFVLNANTALSVKAFWSHADLSVSNVTTASSDMEGYGAAIGLKTTTGANSFVKFEVSYTDFDDIFARRNASGSGSATSVTADPTMVLGTVSIGYKF